MSEPDNIRHTRRERIIIDGWTGAKHVVGFEDDDHFLEDGGVASEIRSEQIAASCGCIADIVGICSVCSEKGREYPGTLCREHYFRCAQCQRPVGPCCSRMYGHGDANRAQRLCKHCHQEAGLRRFSRTVLKALFGFLIEFESEEDGDGQR